MLTTVVDVTWTKIVCVHNLESLFTVLLCHSSTTDNRFGIKYSLITDDGLGKRIIDGLSCQWRSQEFFCYAYLLIFSMGHVDDWLGFNHQWNAIFHWGRIQFNNYLIELKNEFIGFIGHILLNNWNWCGRFPKLNFISRLLDRNWSN